MSKQEEKKRLQIQMDDETAQGVYTNFAMVNHSPNEFTFDFIYVQPSAPKAKVRSRVITSPQHAKMLLKALQENISRYEKNFGEIDLSKLPIQTGTIH